MATPRAKQPGVNALVGLDRLGEWFWFCLSFLLFLILGPFSAPAVLLVLVRLGWENASKEPEPVHHSVRKHLLS